MATGYSKSPLELLNSSHQSKVLKAAIFSRFVLLILSILWRTLLAPYDTSAPLNPTCLHNPSPPLPSPLLPSLGSAIEKGVVWDSVYFVRIAQCGYEYEQFYAFLPLLPACMFVFSQTGQCWRCLVMLFAMWRLFSRPCTFTVIILKDPSAALQASVLFCFNPASIFYSSIYSESLYALFSVGGCYYLVSRANNIAVLWLALSGFARSNGVLNAGYFGFQAMHQAYDAFYLKKSAFLALWILISGALRCICIFVPFITFQAYGYYNMCLGRSSDEMRPWCKARIPLLYNYIQSHYWGVGFLRYFKFKQLPNFLLASPILSLAVCSIIYYVKSRPEIVRSLGFQASVEEKSSMAVIFSSQKPQRSNDTQFSEKYSSRNQGNHNLKSRKKISQGKDLAEGRTVHGSLEKLGYTSAFVLPFILQVGFMAATAFFVMHVQVATRFLSASPSLYWFASLIMTSHKKWGYVIWVYCFAYILLGSLLFSNFYPFT
ncbi:uncharacterized protein LOC105776749 isoform X4 [Gossypium raimondii]|uniref:uncharacterized protein LOC105776749 isoform X4 n=1 Tax=Gossypium raimondii TaxID=29730 RepID=UPI00063ACAB2|nr:uncharacterized protein LOC105776749 isoform X4 [Gossypium raimondii]